MLDKKGQDGIILLIEQQGLRKQIQRAILRLPTLLHIFPPTYTKLK